jgi:hypothetical protein
MRLPLSTFLGRKPGEGKREEDEEEAEEAEEREFGQTRSLSA